MPDIITNTDVVWAIAQSHRAEEKGDPCRCWEAIAAALEAERRAGFLEGCSSESQRDMIKLADRQAYRRGLEEAAEIVGIAKGMLSVSASEVRND